MREILFRGKRIDSGEWTQGAYFPKNDNYPATIYTDDGLGASVDPATVGQYTGLTDKNGKKIFEGDIVDGSETWWASCDPAWRSSPVIPVKWDCDICGFDPFADYDCDCGVYIYGNEVEVIGNIYDNPELLEEVKSNAEV